MAQTYLTPPVPGNLKKSAVGRSDTFKLNPLHIHVVEGFNARIGFRNADEIALLLEELANPTGKVDPQIIADLMELAIKIESNGFDEASPLVIFVDDEKRFCLESGHRRLVCVLYLLSLGKQLEDFGPIYVVRSQKNDMDRQIAVLNQNDGVALNKVEMGDQYKRLKAAPYSLSQEEIARRTGKRPIDISQAITLANAPEDVRVLLAQRILADSTILSLIAGTAEEDREELYQKIKDAAAGVVAEVPAGTSAAKVQRATSAAARKAAGKSTPAERIKALQDYVTAHEGEFTSGPNKARFALLAATVEFMKDPSGDAATVLDFFGE